MKQFYYIAILLLITLSTIQSLQKKTELRKSKFHKSSHKMRVKQDEAPEPIPVELPDVAHSGHHELNEFYDVYRGHHMTSGEIRILFRTADRNKDNKVSFSEWADFHTLFVAPFELVDQRGEYWLEAGDLTFAMDPETGGDWLQGFKLGEGDLEFLVEQFDRWNQDNNLNFADYLFLRKGNLAMSQCADEQGVGSRNLPCALGITSPGRLLSQQDCMDIFHLAYIIEAGQPFGETSRIHFPAFIGIAHLFYYFTEFSLPFDNGVIEKKDVLRGIDEGSLPTTLTPKQVNAMFSWDLYQLPYRGFCGLLWAQRQFSRHDADQNNELSQAEFEALLDQERFNPPLKELIDSMVMPTQEQVEEQAIKRFGRPANERDYLMNFLQKSSKSRKSHLAKKFRSRHRLSMRSRQTVQEDPKYDDPPRTIVYRIFDASLKDQMHYLDFAQFIKYSWCFQTYDVQRAGVINDVSFWQGAKDDLYPIPLNKEEKLIHDQAGDWIGGHQGMFMNLKHFYIFFRYQTIFSWLRTTGMQVHAIQAKIHQGFTQLGLRLAASTEALMHDGYDQLLQEKHYHLKQMVMYALEDEVMALQLLSATEFKESRRR